jgi:hypothetical protein
MAIPKIRLVVVRSLVAKDTANCSISIVEKRLKWSDRILAPDGLVDVDVPARVGGGDQPKFTTATLNRDSSGCFRAWRWSRAQKGPSSSFTELA